MELKVAKYIVAIDDYKSITKAAESLFITQSALNQILLKEEDEIGAKLFYRSKKGLRVTPAGEIYVDNARQILKMNRNTLHHIHDMENNPTGTVHFGLSYEHGIDVFVAISRDFDRQFPNVRIQMRETTIHNMRKNLREGTIDIGLIMQKEKPDSSCQFIHVCTEPLVCGVPKKRVPTGAVLRWDKPLPVISLEMLKQERFALMFQGSTMREVIDPLFERAGYVPDVHYETLMNHALSRLTANGLCSTIMPISYAEEDENIAWFRLEDDPHWDWWMIYANDHYLSAAEKKMIQLSAVYAKNLEEYWRNHGVGMPAAKPAASL